MAKDKKHYTAEVGLTFDKLNLRVEAGQPVPDKVSEAEIQELLKQGWIKEAE